VPLPDDYDSPAGEAAASVAIKGALGACFLIIGGSFGFTTELVHDRPRYPRTDEQWEAVGTIVDPETENGDIPTRLTRYCSFKFSGFRRAGKELTIRYQMVLSFGFKDEYASDPTKNSYADIESCLFQYGKFLADNPNLGLDDRVTHRQLEVLADEFLPASKQGDANIIYYSRIEVVLNVCQV
jgi:hypothetical protein